MTWGTSWHILMLKLLCKANLNLMKSAWTWDVSGGLCAASATALKRLMVVWKREATSGFDANGKDGNFCRSKVATVPIGKPEPQEGLAASA